VDKNPRPAAVGEGIVQGLVEETEMSKYRKRTLNIEHSTPNNETNVEPVKAFDVGCWMFGVSSQNQPSPLRGFKND
jgi:hypothetical protein